MKKTTILLVIVLCLSLLSACGGDKLPELVENPSGNPSTNSTYTPDKSTEQENKNETAFLLPEYDYTASKLKLTDLSTGNMTASYAFDTAQMSLLTEMTSQGVVAMLSSQQEADVQNTGGIMVITGNSSVETLNYWLFDLQLNLMDVYELTDETLVSGLWGSVVTVAPDGKSLVYAEGSSLYQYNFDTQELREITPVMSETVYFEAIEYSDSGSCLAFFGSPNGQENATAYGSIDLHKNTASVFTADNFSASMLSVTGEYAAISRKVPPASMGGAKQTGSVIFLDLAGQHGKVIPVESGEESGIAAVSADGQYIVTCVGGDSPSGIMRVYQVSNGTKIVDKTYSMDKKCKPYEIWVIGHSAYATLGTEDGYAISQAVELR